MDFGQIVVAAKHFLAIWQVQDIPQKIREDVAAHQGAPSTFGKQFAKKYSSQKRSLLKLATWNGADLLPAGMTFLFASEYRRMTK
ncbi:MAG: hypothetical protein K8F62_13845 [Pseudorhodoplanes sp.]|nr:hypothetical protein [Pseudorhodoplanes sp.]